MKRTDQAEKDVCLAFGISPEPNLDYQINTDDKESS